MPVARSPKTTLQSQHCARLEARAPWGAQRRRLGAVPEGGGGFRSARRPPNITRKPGGPVRTGIDPQRIETMLRGARRGIAVAAALGVASAGAGASEASPSTALYKTPGIPIKQRADDLLARMTLEEKVVSYFVFRILTSSS